jgi:hypothetical protein
MLGPVFYLEALLAGRRGRQHFLRWFVGAILVVQLLGFFIGYRENVQEGLDRYGLVPSFSANQFATDFTHWVVNQQFLIILLATPALAAGAITDEKTRGTLLYLFSADLTSWEILIGKLLGRSLEVGVLLLVTLPFLCFVGVWAGMTPVGLLAILLALVAPVFAVGSASLLMSVWCRQTRDAVIGLFTIGGLIYLLWYGLNWAGGLTPAVARLRRLTGYFDPFHVAGPAIAGIPARQLAAYVVGSWLAWGSVGTVCFGVAVWRLRTAYMRQLEYSGKRGIGEWVTPLRAPVSDEPMLWKERHVDGIAPLGIMKIIPRWFALPVISLLTFGLLIALLAYGNGQYVGNVLKWILTLDLAQLTSDQNFKPGETAAAFFILGAIDLVLACLVVGIRCSGSICGEREKQTWEALLLTPLVTKQLIRIKLWGILGAAVPYVLAYLIPTLILATLLSPREAWLLMAAVLAFTLLLVFLFRRRLDSFATFWIFLGISILTMVGGLWLSPPLFVAVLMVVVTTLAMFYMGAAGIWSSARSNSSWRSLLSTMLLGYVGGLILWLATTPITLIIAILLYMLFAALAAADAFLGTQALAFAKQFEHGIHWVVIMASCIVLAGAFLGVPWIFIFNAERRVSERERIRIWREEDLRIPGRRRRRYRRLKTSP